MSAWRNSRAIFGDALGEWTGRERDTKSASLMSAARRPRKSTAQARYRSLRPRGAVNDCGLYSWGRMVNGCLTCVSTCAPTYGRNRQPPKRLLGMGRPSCPKIAPAPKPGGSDRSSGPNRCEIAVVRSSTAGLQIGTPQISGLSANGVMRHNGRRTGACTLSAHGRAKRRWLTLAL